MKPKKSGIVEELKKKHKVRLAEAQQEMEKEMATPRTHDDSYLSDVRLFSKWAYRVGKGWYGFSLGDVPRVWTDILDEFRCWLEIQCPDFEIHQVKMKLGMLRFYAGTKTHLVIPDEKIRAEIFQLQDLLRTPQNIRNMKAALRARKRHQKKPRRP